MKTLSIFTKQYNISKTLRFALKPIGKTSENISNFILKDFQIADEYERAKAIIDDYHRDFIEIVLSSKTFLTEENIKKAYQAYKNDTQEFETIQKNLCEEVGKEFEEANKKYFVFDQYNELFKSLSNPNSVFSEWLKSKSSKDDYENNLCTLLTFKSFTTYFTGFNDNRKHIYAKENKHGSIGYRICENLLRYFDNCKTFEQHKDILTEVLKDYIDLFESSNFSQYISQKQIDQYNVKIGSTSEQSVADKGINQLINEYRQKHNVKLPYMKELYKQMLSISDSAFKLDAFTSDEECLAAIQDWWNKSCTFLINTINLVGSNLSENDYIKTDSLTEISSTVYGDWSFIETTLNKDSEKIKKTKAQSITTLNNYISNYISENDLDAQPLSFIEYFTTGATNLRNEIEQKYTDNKEILESTTIHKGKTRESDFEKIKTFLDSILDFVRFLDPLYLVHEFKKIDGISVTAFYSEFEKNYETLRSIYSLYNKVRNYATKKPYSTEKIKLNFENSQLLNGWDLNKEKDCTGILFLKDNQYYLGILNKNSNSVLDYRISEDDKTEIKKRKKLELQTKCIATGNDDFYEKLVYKLIPDPTKMLPKVFFSQKGITKYNPSETLIKINKEKTFKTNKKHLSQIIEYYQNSISKHEWSNFFNFKFKRPNEYSTYQEFLSDIEKTSYTISFDDKIKTSYINSLVEEGKLFLFKLHSKDFSEHSKGKPNLHTLYWKAIFEKENLKNLVVKLNGQAEVFYRKASIDNQDVIIHKANETINNKNPLNKKAQSTFAYDLIKDKRYTQDQFLFHCPITLNVNADNENKFNFKVNEFLKDNKDINIIGIDRGERHLLYYSIINQKGEIIEQNSLNILTSDNNYQVDYNALLTKRAEKRQNERKTWKAVEGIKDLKSGYLSHVIHKLAKLMIEHNAVIALENLNMGFKNSRKRFEQSVYQNFEKALIEKLNYLVFKDRNPTEPGGYLNAYQLTSKFESLKKLNNQTGFLFYVPAAHTSKIDAITGFIDTLYPKYENLNKAKEFFSKFKSINYNKKENYVEFTYDVNDFTSTSESTNLKKSTWTLCTHGDYRYYISKDKKTSKYETKKVNITENLTKLFIDKNISYIQGNDIKNEIVKISDKAFFESLIWNLKILLQMRYSYKNEEGEEIDFILSPVADKNGHFFDTRKYDNGCNSIPKDADANGAYNIARKGLYFIQNISDDLKLPKTINKIEWMNYVQKDV